jgi:hypothetical protein
MTYTIAWSATVPGFVRKKKPSVMWKRHSEVRIVFAEMRAMATSSTKVRSLMMRDEKSVSKRTKEYKMQG